MTPLKALVGLVALLFDAFFGKKTEAWPDGEQPLIDPPKEYPPDWALTWTGDTEVSAGSAIEARVDAPADEVPTPGRAHTPGVGHLPCAHPFGYDHSCARCGHSGGNMTIHPDALKDSLVDHPTLGDWYREVFQRGEPGPDRPKATKGLMISAAIGLREFAESQDCETPTFWRSIADQLDPK